jgi:hypothetical protein
MSHFGDCILHIDSIYLMRHLALLLLNSIAFPVLDSIMSYGRSKRVIDVDEFERPIFLDSRNVEISISSRKIAVILPGNYLQYHVIYIRDKHFRFLSHPRTMQLCNHPVRFSSTDPLGLDNWLFVPSPVTFTVTSYVGYDMLYCHSCHPILSKFSSSSCFMGIPNVTEVNQFHYSTIWENRNVKMNIQVSSTKIRIMFHRNYL